MRLSDCIPLAEAHLWAGSKDLRRTASRARRLVQRWDPLLSEYRPLDALEALSAWRGATLNRYRASLGSLLRAYRLAGGPRLELPPAAPEGRPRDRVLTDEECHLLGAAEPAAAVLLETGLRLSELYRATREGPYLIIEDTKNGDRRVVPCSQELPVLPPERTLRRRWARACARLGLEGVTPHTCRHTAITRWVEAGLDLATVRALAGHRSLSTTLRYTHLSPEHLAREVARVGLTSGGSCGTL